MRWQLKKSLSTPKDYILGVSAKAEYQLGILNDLYLQRFLSAAVSLLPKSISKVLELGCGSGHLLSALLPYLENTHIYATDVSKERLTECKLRLGETGSNTLDFTTLSITDTDFEICHDQDLILVRFVITHMKNAQAILERIVKAMKPGAKLFIEEFCVQNEFIARGETFGYYEWPRAHEFQEKLQHSHFDVGMDLLAALKKNSRFSIDLAQINQPILDSEYRKSIIRLGMQDCSQELLSHHFGKEKLAQIFTSLEMFERDAFSFGLAPRSVCIFGTIRDEK